MPERDSPINFDDLPSLQAEKRGQKAAPKAAAPQPTEPKNTQAPPVKKPPAASNRNLSVAVMALLVVAVLGLSFMAYSAQQSLQQQQRLHIASEERIKALEARLSTTDESLSQSSVSMQLRLVELSQQANDIKGQLDKFLASTWKRNQTDISEINQKAADVGKKLQTINTTLAQLEKDSKAANKEQTALKAELQKQTAELQKQQASAVAEINALTAAQKNAEQQIKAVADLRKQLEGFTAQQKKLQQQVDDNTGWIESNNAFRQQTNQTLNRLDQQIKALQKPAL